MALLEVDSVVAGYGGITAIAHQPGGRRGSRRLSAATAPQEHHPSHDHGSVRRRAAPIRFGAPTSAGWPRTNRRRRISLPEGRGIFHGYP
jgi:hypothetical protein